MIAVSVAVLLQAAAPLGQAGISERNTIQSPNSIERWPADGSSAYRWVIGAWPDKAPFLVASYSGDDVGQMAVRWAVDPAIRGADGIYYVAMRQTSEGLEEADSRECAFGDVVRNLRTMSLPQPLIPGTEPVQSGPTPRSLHRGASIQILRAKQPDGSGADIGLSSSDGEIWAWSAALFAATRDCWKPMTPPAPLTSP